MRELISSPSVFYTTAITLHLMLLISGISLYLNAKNNDTNQRILFWLKLIISIPLLLLGVSWATFVTTGFGVAALIGSSLNLRLVLLALAPIVIYTIGVWGLIRWIRNKRFANASVVIVIIISVCVTYIYQREWLHSI